ncbi:MAG: sigma factor-like helix-turn-helix DNA-binding protein [Mariprofundales bacterium]
MELQQNRHAIARWLHHLSEREQQVISRRFGLSDTPESTLEQIGRDLECSKERVRQIQMSALHKLQTLMEQDYLQGAFQ